VKELSGEAWSRRSSATTSSGHDQVESDPYGGAGMSGTASVELVKVEKQLGFCQLRIQQTFKRRIRAIVTSAMMLAGPLIKNKTMTLWNRK
jgi:hypothetical protein